METLPAGRRPEPPDRDDRGATYYWLEGQALRTRTAFSDAVVVSERGPDGDFSTRLTDLQGNEIARLNVDRVGATDSVVVYQPTQGNVLRANGRSGLRTPLDWGNEQAYSLWKDGTESSTNRLEWQEGVIRPAGKAKRDLKRAIVEIRTEWNGGFAAKAVKKRGPRKNLVTGATWNGDAVITTFTKDDVVIGSTEWYADEQLFVWRFRGLTEGDVDASRLQQVGGWRFTPDVAWTNIQAYAFYQFHTKMNDEHRVARANPGWAGRLVGLVMPTLSANQPGCDNLHWLDRSVFRPCCDSHDYCYEKRGCSSSSWWQWWSSWRCDGCNIAAVACFASGLRGPYYPYPYPYWF
ncbi:MAG: hypothetical protein GEU82_10185 [Luteitalea sp.]|nr:hypothetical protein [Luteitalea sp.]